MGCCGAIIPELAALVDHLGDCCEPSPCARSCAPQCCYPPATQPFAQVTMTCPPPCLAPTVPQPVKPLRLPCPYPPEPAQLITEEQFERSRVNNFYNNYNIDWHNESPTTKNDPCTHPLPSKPTRKPCEDYRIRPNEECIEPGCPTGFKPCSMKLTPPVGCDPRGIWCAQVQPCPPKPKSKDTYYNPGPCKRPCCKHWKPKEGPCLYDDPCKADCFNHPPGMKPSGRYP